MLQNTAQQKPKAYTFTSTENSKKKRKRYLIQVSMKQINNESGFSGQ